jgi:hypothetical protein
MLAALALAATINQPFELASKCKAACNFVLQARVRLRVNDGKREFVLAAGGIMTQMYTDEMYVVTTDAGEKIVLKLERISQK